MRSVSLTFVPEAQVNDFVLVHVGVALSVVDEQEAAETFAHLKQMSEIEDLKTPDPASAPHV